MKPLRILTASEQVTEHLRREVLRGAWAEIMPGAERLAAELGVGIHTVAEALQQLEREGLLAGRGRRHRRRIVRPMRSASSSLRVTMLLYERSDEQLDFMVDLRHRLIEDGHEAGFAAKTMTELNMDVGRVAALVRRTKSDAWVVWAGSREVLGWFAGQPVPAFALAGRRRGIQIAGAGPEKGPAVRAAMRRLAELGHERIVMLGHEERRKPYPGLMERIFLQELKLRGIRTGAYHLPDWEESPEGLEQCLHGLFAVTPPTAMFIDDVALFLAVERDLAHLGLLAPRQVSLVCTDPSPVFQWFRPTVAHIHWDSRLLVRRVLRWARNMACGKDDRRQTLTKARFVDGGTVGPPPESSGQNF